MERQTFCINFYIKRKKLLKNDEAPIYMRVTINGEHWEQSIKRSVDPDLWDKSKGMVKVNASVAGDLNDYMELLKRKIYGIRKELIDENIPVTTDEIKERYLSHNAKSKGLLSLFSEHNSRCEDLVGKNYAPGTIDKFKFTYNHVQAYIRWKYKREEMPLNRINEAFITGFEHYLKTVKKCSNNTTVKYIRYFQQVIREALKNDWIKSDPFRHVTLRLKEVHREALTEEEVEKLANKKLDIEKFDRVRDVFVFCCHTGLPYADVEELCADHLETDDDGIIWIKKERKKTSQVAEIPVDKIALSILKKYENDPYCKSRGKLLPVLSNQKYNDYLKTIADIVGIKKHLTTHLARHTFATNMLQKRISMEAVSKMLGHADISMTKQYAKIKRDLVRDQITQHLPDEYKVPEKVGSNPAKQTLKGPFGFEINLN